MAININDEKYKKFKSELLLFAGDFKVGNNELYAKYLEETFGKKVATAFVDYFTKTLGGDIQSFTPTKDRNEIVIKALIESGLENSAHVENCISLQEMRFKIKDSKTQEDRSRTPDDYIVMENLNNIYCELRFEKNGEYTDYDGNLRTYETEFLNGNLLLTPEEYNEFFTAFNKVAYPVEWNEISEDRFYDMMNVLPPLNHQSLEGVEFFQIEEMQTSNITNTFANLNGKYYESFQKTTADFSALAKEIKDLALEGTQRTNQDSRLEAKEVLKFNHNDNTGNIALLVDGQKCANLIATGHPMQETDLVDISNPLLSKFLTELAQKEDSFLASRSSSDGLYLDEELILPANNGNIVLTEDSKYDSADLSCFLNEYVAERMEIKEIENQEAIQETWDNMKNQEDTQSSVFSEIDYSSENFTLLDNQSKCQLMDYINEQSDKIVNAALEEEKLKQEQSADSNLRV